MKNHTKIFWSWSCKTLIGVKLLRIRLDKVNGFIRVDDGTRYLVLLGSEKYDAIYHKIRWLIDQETYARMKIK